MYNYRKIIKADILDYIKDNYTVEEISEKLADRDEWEQELNDDLWTADSVTGNGSGSYFFNTYKAEEALAHNWEILREVLQDFGCADCNPLEKGAEWCDVTIRCYLLGECLGAALDELEESHGVAIPF